MDSSGVVCLSCPSVCQSAPLIWSLSSHKQAYQRSCPSLSSSLFLHLSFSSLYSSLSLSISISLHLFISISLHLSFSLHLHISLSFSLFLHLPVSLSLSLPRSAEHTSELQSH